MIERTPVINRERLSVTIGLILLALALIPLLNTPGRSVGASVFGSELDISITPAGLITLLAAGLACAGVDMLIQVHPHVRSGRAGPTFVFWLLPALAVIATAQWLSRAPTGQAWAAQLFASGVALWIIIRAEFGAVDPDAAAAGRWRLLLNVIAYVLAFGLFAMIWETRVRSLITATLMAVVALLLSIDLMWVTRAGARRVVLHSLAVALVIGECAWALNYWRANTATAGLALVLIFYALSGIAAQHLFGKLTRRVLIEFGVVVAVALVLLVTGVRS
ncbi:MAG TPA: hypothetical protein VJG32_12375 [Anaerolineae bacterium]|nr:hypothetical protein [Anaerolineae bacterium]